MRRIVATLAALIAVAWMGACTPKATVDTRAPAAQAVIGPEGYGPVRVGMTLGQANAALGHPLVAEGASDDPMACQTYMDGPLGYMTEQGIITRISGGPGAESVRTAAGIGVGSSDAEVRAAYPNLVEEPAKYEGPPAHDLIAWTTPNQSGIRFEIDASGKVARLHAGGPSILYMEGCL